MEKAQTKRKFQVISNIFYMLKSLHAASPTRIWLEIAMAILNSITNIMFSMGLLKIIAGAIAKEITPKFAIGCILFIVCYKFIMSIINNLFQNKYLVISNQNITKYFSQLLYNKATEVELECYENPDFYNSYVLAISESNTRCMEVLSNFTAMINNIFNMFSMSFIVILINPWLMIFVLVPVVFQILIVKKDNQLDYDNYVNQTKILRKRDYISRVFYLKEYSEDLKLTNIRNVLKKYFTLSFNELFSVIKEYGFKLLLLDISKFFVFTIFGYFGAVIFSCYQTIVLKTMKLSNCIIILNAIGNVGNSILSVISVFADFIQQSLYIENLRFFLEYEIKIKQDNNADQPPKEQYQLSFQNVYFKYSNSDIYSLKNINFDIKPKERVAIVGINGAGKSTLIKLLLRLYDPEKGKITLNGKDIKEYRLKEYRNLFSTVFQDFKIFSLSIKDNILLGDHCDDEKIQDALKKVGLYEKIDMLKNKIDTILNREFDDEGEILSGGEAQKIALSRAFLNKNDIIILDEPSSALDPISEYNMYKSMLEAGKNKTVIFISHRLSSATLADKIYVMDDAQIVESGSHQELMAKKGLYFDMFNKQAEDYVEQVV